MPQQVPQQVPLSDPVDFEVLRDYLDSDRAPPECMDLSQLDGFLAGIVSGPEPILPSEWLPLVWDNEEPFFDTEAEARSVLGMILRRYNDIADSLDAQPPTFAPVFWEAQDGTPIVEDWAHGFMQAVALRAEAWEPVLRDEESAILLIPIGIIASQAVPDLDESMRLPEDTLEELLADADMTVTACAVGLRAFWRERSGPSQARH